MGKKIESVFTDDLGKCFVTGSTTVALHHVFGKFNRRRSELYGYVVPLAPLWHNIGNNSVHMRPNDGLDLFLKRYCQVDFEKKHGTRDEFIRLFGKSYL